MRPLPDTPAGQGIHEAAGEHGYRGGGGGAVLPVWSDLSGGGAGHHAKVLTSQSALSDLLSIWGPEPAPLNPTLQGWRAHSHANRPRCQMRPIAHPLIWNSWGHSQHTSTRKKHPLPFAYISPYILYLNIPHILILSILRVLLS